MIGDFGFWILNFRLTVAALVLETQIPDLKSKI
jgi:hypothetical protein